jgi:hypothetical protein
MISAYLFTESIAQFWLGGFDREIRANLIQFYRMGEFQIPDFFREIGDLEFTSKEIYVNECTRNL